jgi:phenylacetate-CoA ligase
MKRFWIMVVATLDTIFWHIDMGPGVHKFLLAPGVGDFREFLGKVRAVRLYYQAKKKVPAYKKHLAQYKNIKGPKISFLKVSLGDIPETDKADYIKQSYITDKLWHGVLPEKGVMFDESSGSSGTPTSWVRGPRERRVIQRVIQVVFAHHFKTHQPIVINTFSMGAWATGLNTTINIVGIARIKSTGPDIIKVIDTLKELGPNFEYVISGYPPFLKQVADSTEIDWKKYKIWGIYGGEGISEAMRDSLLEKYVDIVGSYGASDLEINIGHETEFTVALRRALIKDEKLRAALLRQNRGIIPMIFQYNPYDYVIETNDKGEMLVTIARLENLSPRIRYNIHDLGHAEPYYKLRETLKKLGRKDLLKFAEFDFAVLFHYGRSDLSVDYNGAVVGPEEVKQIINESEFANLVSAFRLISYEDKASHKHLLIAIEEAAKISDETSAKLLERLIEQLQIMNLDFKSAHRTSPLKPEIRVYAAGTGIFDPAHQKLKNDYVWNIDYERAKAEHLIK